MTADLPMLAAVAASAVGALVGCATGLVPGLHSNNLAAAFASFPAAVLAVVAFGALSQGAPGAMTVVACAVVGCAVAHTVAGAVPSIFLAAPEGESVLSMLPGHRLLRAGRGSEALRLSVASSLGALGLSLAILVPVRCVLGPPINMHDRLLPWLGPVLLLVAALMVAGESRRAPHGRRRLAGWRASTAALAVLLLSALLGYLVVFSPHALLAGRQGGGGIGALFVGLFGLPTILWAVLDPPKEVPVEDPDAGLVGYQGRGYVGPVIRGVLAGALIGWFPGTSSGQATMLAVSGDGRDGGDDLARARRYVAGSAAVSAASTVFNLAALATFLRVRSGTAAAVLQLTSWQESPWGGGPLPGPQVAVLLLAVAIGGAIAAPMTLLTGRIAAGRARSLGDRRLLVLVALILMAGCIASGGPRAALVLAAATPLGLLPPQIGIMRVHLMGAMTIPVAMVLMLG